MSTSLLLTTVAVATHVELCVEDNQLGAGGDDIVALVGPHELGKHRVLVLVWNTSFHIYLPYTHSMTYMAL